MLAYYENNKIPYRIFRHRAMEFPFHLHRELELVYVEKGMVEVLDGDGSLEVREGECCLIFPNHIHGYRSEEGAEGILLIAGTELTPEFAKTFHAWDCVNPIIRASVLHPDAVYCLNRLLEERDAGDCQEITKGFLTILYGRLLNVLEIVPLHYRETMNLMHKMLLYINDHYKEPLSLEILAKELGASKYHLSRIFTKKIHCGFHEYINTIRISFVRQQLKYSEKRISEIAFESGFENLHTFNRVFQNICGMTPSEFRKGRGT